MSNAGSTEDVGVRLSLSGQSQFNQGIDEASSKVTHLGAKSDEAGRKGKAAGVGIGQAFSPLRTVFANTNLAATPLGMTLSALSDTASGLGRQLDDIDKRKPGAHLQTLGTYGAVGGAGVFAAGAALDALGSPMEASKRQLQTAITDSGGNFDDFGKQITSTEKHMENFGDRTSTTDQALATLTQGLNSPTLALKYIGEAADIAAARHESLGAAAQSVVLIHAGATRALRQFGITATTSTKTAAQLTSAQKESAAAAAHLHTVQQRLSDLQLRDSAKSKLTISDQIALRNAHTAVSDAQAKQQTASEKLQTAQAAANVGAGSFATNMDLIAQRTRGQASAAVDSFGGRLDILKAKVLDVAGRFGQKYGPAIMGTGAALTGLGSIMTATGSVISHFARAGEAAATASEAATSATEGLSVATETQMTLFDADTLSVDALAGSLDAAAASEAAAAGGFDLMSVAATIFDAIPIVALVVGIIAAVVALGYGIYWVATHWKESWSAIKGAAKDVWNWITENWPYLVGVLLGPFGIAAALIYKHWSDIKGYGVDAENFMESTWDKFIKFLESVPGRIGKFAVHMFDGIGNALKDTINWGIGMWDSIADKTTINLPKIHIWGVGDVGGGSVGPLLPTLPKLHAGGTVVTSGSAMIRPNEEAVHLPSGAKVVPLSGGDAMGAGAYGPIGPVTLQVVLDRKVLAKAVYDDLRDQSARR